MKPIVRQWPDRALTGQMMFSEPDIQNALVLSRVYSYKRNKQILYALIGLLYKANVKFGFESDNCGHP